MEDINSVVFFAKNKTTDMLTSHRSRGRQYSLPSVNKTKHKATKRKITKQSTNLASLDPHPAAPQLQQELVAGREVSAAMLTPVLPDAVVDRLVRVRVRARTGLLSPLCRKRVRQG